MENRNTVIQQSGKKFINQTAFRIMMGLCIVLFSIFAFTGSNAETQITNQFPFVPAATWEEAKESDLEILRMREDNEWHWIVYEIQEEVEAAVYYDCDNGNFWYAEMDMEQFVSIPDNMWAYLRYGENGRLHDYYIGERMTDGSYSSFNCFYNSQMNPVYLNFSYRENADDEGLKYTYYFKDEEWRDADDEVTDTLPFDGDEVIASRYIPDIRIVVENPQHLTAGSFAVSRIQDQYVWTELSFSGGENPVIIHYQIFAKDSDGNWKMTWEEDSTLENTWWWIGEDGEHYLKAQVSDGVTNCEVQTDIFTITVNEPEIISKFLDPNEQTQEIMAAIEQEGNAFIQNLTDNQTTDGYCFVIGDVVTYLLDNVPEGTTSITLNYVFDNIYQVDSQIIVIYFVPTENGQPEWVAALGEVQDGTSAQEEGSINVTLSEDVIRKINGKEVILMVVSVCSGITSQILDPNEETQTIMTAIAQQGLDYFPNTIKNQLSGGYSEIGDIVTYVLDNVPDDITLLTVRYELDNSYQAGLPVYVAYGIPTDNGSTEWVLARGEVQESNGDQAAGRIDVNLTEDIIRRINGKEVTLVVISLFSPDDLDTLTLPASLTRIEEEAFAGITAQAVVLPQGCSAVESRAFANCPNLTYVLAPEDTEIAADAFEGCDNVTIKRY